MGDNYQFDSKGSIPAEPDESCSEPRAGKLQTFISSIIYVLMYLGKK